MCFTRRKFAYCSLGALSAIAGCAGLAGEPQVKVAKIKGVNSDTKPHTLAVTLSENDEIIHQSEHEVNGDSAQGEGTTFVIEESLPDRPGRYELEAMLDNSGTERLDLASEYDGNSLQIIIEIDQQENLSIWVSPTPLNN